MSVHRDDFSIAFRSALLQRGGAQKFSILSLVTLAVLIFFLDVYGFTFIKSTRSIINDVIFRVSYLVSSPTRLTPKISKNIYHAQVEKYKNIVEEIEQEHMNKQNMEDDLMNYVETELLV